MPQHHIEFQFQGKTDDPYIHALKTLLADILPDWPQQTIEKTGVPARGDKSDPIAIAALAVATTSLIVAIPGGVLATWNLAERIKLKEKIDRLLVWVQERAATLSQSSPTMHLPNGKVIPLGTVKPEEILDMLDELYTKEL
jgi:hypothetical protein